MEGLPASAVLADAAYDSDHIRTIISEKNALAVIPNNPSLPKDRDQTTRRSRRAGRSRHGSAPAPCGSFLH
jgi:hypothetical protein